MYHENHPDGSYEMANQVLAFEPPRVISWKPGYVSPATGKLEFGGWIWRYDLTQLGPDETMVTLSYDWSAVGPDARQRIQFPPFTPDHLDNSLSRVRPDTFLRTRLPCSSYPRKTAPRHRSPSRQIKSGAAGEQQQDIPWWQRNQPPEQRQ
jgi:hypothetical protein